jgi:peptidoglycan/LPS O-acetylase OafA/YrhL
VVVGHFVGIYPRLQAVLDRSPLHAAIAGHEAVILFFLLSGFVLAVPFSGRERMDYVPFMVKRVVRIWFPFAAAVVLAALGSLALHSRVPTGNPWIDQTWSCRPSIRLVVQHFLMIGHYDSAQLNTAFWSLVYEMRISLVYPALYWASRRMGPRMLLPGAFLVGVAAAFYADHSGHEGLSYNFVCAFFFLAGIYLQRNIGHITSWVDAQVGAVKIAMLALCVGCFDGPGAFPAISVHGFTYVPMFLRESICVAGAVGILVGAVTIGGFRTMLNQPRIRRLGEISYSLYLVHGTVLFVLIRLFYGKPLLAALFPAYILASYWLAEGMHRLVEVPTMQMARVLSEKVKNRGLASRQYAAE